jgi:serine/threonine-protein kinase HipA
MRIAKILYNEEEAGIITQHDDGSFSFRYHDEWMRDDTKSGFCRTMPKTQQLYQSNYLFPYFFNIIPEGANRKAICTDLKIDEDDYFGILLVTGKHDVIGAVKVVEI